MEFKSIVQTYIQEKRPLIVEELNWFRQQPTLKAAVEVSALAINSKDKRLLHQRRLKKVTLEKAKELLFTNLDELEKCQSFEELFLFVKELVNPTKGVGELYIYDTTLRIGAKMNLLPTKIYLHAGTRVGARALGFSGKLKYLDKQDLPTDFNELEPYEIEDLLCIFKSDLEKVDISSDINDFLQRSRCR